LEVVAGGQKKALTERGGLPADLVTYLVVEVRKLVDVGCLPTLSYFIMELKLSNFLI
jgi:hypothetical protein